MASRWKELEGKAGYLGFTLAERMFLRMGPIGAERAGARLGMLFYRLVGRRRRLMLSNLELAMPELSPERRVEIAKACARHFFIVFADFIRSSRRTDEEVKKSCPLVDFHYYDEALALGKGALMISAHMGNWERAAHAIVAAGYKFTIVVRDADDSGVNRAVERLRTNHGIGLLSRGSAARQILRKLANNEIIGILPDQNSGDIFIPFFGKPTGTLTGPAQIHLKTGAPIIPMISRRMGPDLYEARAYPSIVAVEGYDPVEGIMRGVNNALESAIRETPEQWLWFHDRWKSARREGLL